MALVEGRCSMTDYFALLNEPRRPWVDPDLLKTRFLELSAEVHPDRVHGAPEEEKRRAHQRYLELNSAYNCLREPKMRLRHLLELESGRRLREIQPIASGGMDLFLEIGQLCRGADSFLAERAKVTSPLLRVGMFERAQDWIDKLNAARRTLVQKQEELSAELKRMNLAWEEAPAAGPARSSSLPMLQLERLSRDLSYLGRCVAQIQERITQLSF